jgi:hypothetical protein
MGTRITDLPIATEADLEDATVDYVLGLVNGATKLIPTSILIAPDTNPPGVPTGLTASPDDTQVTLNWDDNAEGDLDHYDYRVDAGTATSTGDTSLIVVTGLTNAVEYDFQVRAVDTSNNASAWSAVVSATPIIILDGGDASGGGSATNFDGGDWNGVGGTLINYDGGTA